MKVRNRQLLRLVIVMALITTGLCVIGITQHVAVLTKFRALDGRVLNVEEDIADVVTTIVDLDGLNSQSKHDIVVLQDECSKHAARLRSLMAEIRQLERILGADLGTANESDDETGALFEEDLDQTMLRERWLHRLGEVVAEDERGGVEKVAMSAATSAMSTDEEVAAADDATPTVIVTETPPAPIASERAVSPERLSVSGQR